MVKHHEAGVSLLHWLVTGPYTLDVSDRYQDNYIVEFPAYEDLWGAASGALTGPARPAEGEALSLWGQESSWRLLQTHPAEQRITFARFGVSATLMSTLLCASIRVPTPGRHTLTVSYSGAMQLWVNGRCLVDTHRIGRVDTRQEVSVDLLRGGNDVRVLLFNVHLHCLNTLHITLDCPCETDVNAYPMDERLRAAAEAGLQGFYLSQAVLEPGRDQWLESVDLPDGCTYTWRLLQATGDGAAGVFDPVARAVRIATYDQLAGVGGYSVALACQVAGHTIHGKPLSFQRIEYQSPPKGLDAAARKRYMLEQIAQNDCPNLRAIPYQAFCQIAVGRADKVDEAAVQTTIDYINDRYDCADFALHGLLRLYLKYGDALSEGLRANIKACILNFKYWVDEPGRSLMFTRSENHEILFHSAEYIAGLAFPLDIFPSSGQNGLFHELKGRMRAERWIREKGHFGFVEWHSNSYYEEDILAMLNIWDFGEENGYLRQYARQLVDLISLFIASNSYQGIMATTHGRCYENAIMHPHTEGMSRLNWLLFGAPEKMDTHLSIGAAILADSAYLPPAAAVQMAVQETPLDTRTRMGLFRHAGRGGVNCATYRTADYMVSGLVESQYGEHGAQVQAGQALLAGEVPVFVSCFADRSPTTRPSYWGGQHVIPKTIAHRCFLAYVVRMGGGLGYSHCYFPEQEFDETARSDRWLFGRRGHAYIAVFSQNPYEQVAEGQYKRRELLCLHKRNIWCLELGSETEYGSFAAFRAAISAAAIREEGEELVYDSPSIGRVFLSWDEDCTLDGVPFAAEPFPLIGNPYVEAEYGGGVIRYLREKGREINFF